MCNLGRRNARTRLAHLICEIGIRMENAGLGDRDSFGFAATKAHIADALGMTSVHLNRVLQGLRGDGLVTWREGLVSVSNRTALEKIAEFDAAYLQGEMTVRVPAAAG